MTTDRIIENARIVDGTGAPWFRGAVLIRDGQIDRVVRSKDNDISADERLNVDGAVLTPGFIDTHSHSDLELFADPTLAPKTRQGITTEILGQDGFSMAPMYRKGGSDEWRQHLKGLAGNVDVEWTWESIEEYLATVEEQGVAPNVATLVGHGTVRYNVLGMEDRAPTDRELMDMAELVTEGLEQGAIGFSTGLVYSPQVNASTYETQTLAGRLAPFQRPFVAHIRSEGRWIWEALDEFVDIGAEEGIPLHLSHYKVSGSAQIGKAGRANQLIETARERGIDFTAEQYPYTAGNTLLSAVLPPWVHADGPDETLERISDEETRERIRRDTEEWRIDGWENQGARTGWDNIVVTNIDNPKWTDYQGSSVASVASDRQSHPVDVVCDLLIAEDLDVAMLLHAMDEPDVREIMANERVCIATDGLFGTAPHPRTYGTYARVLGKYVREEGVLTLEEAVRKMTSLPARAMGLERKGLIRPGMDADLVVFRPETVSDRGTYDAPRQHPTGITHVLVNGEFIVRSGSTTENTPGEVITGKQ